MLVGREREQQVLADLVGRARSGSAGSLVVRGEPGAGKSALLDWLTGDTDDALTLRAQGLEAEAPLAFAALHRLLRPVMHLRDVLPAPQARALGVAFGENDGPPVEPFLVGVATLSMLTAAAEESLVLCLVDDAHWLDPASRDSLLFCARRVDADHVLMVFAVRADSERPFRADGLADLLLEGLSPDAARALCGLRLGDTDDRLVERLIAETGGNPLALLELPTGLSAAQLSGDEPLPAHLPLTGRVEQVFLDRSRRLEPSVQTALLLAAADDTGELAVLRAAAARLTGSEHALAAALASGLLGTDRTTVEVRHPLVRSALYQAADLEERRRVHLALADTLAETGDADRETWHRAAAATGPDAALADALEQAGARAERRGGFTAGLAAYERASQLADDPRRRAALALAAARNAWSSGQVARAGELLASAGASEDPALVGGIARLRGRMEVNLGSATDAHRIFVEGARAIHAVDPPRALEMAAAAAVMATYGADSGARIVPDLVLAGAATDPSPRQICLAQMLRSMTRVSAADWSGAVADLEPALRAGDEVEDLDVLVNLGNAALQLGDEPAQQHAYSLALSRARGSGAVMTVIYTLQRLCFGHLVAGEWNAVRSAAEESLTLSLGTGPPALGAPSLAWLTLLAALQGRDEYDVRLGELETITATHPLGVLTDPVHDLTRWAQGVHAAASGDRVGALHHLSLLRLPVVARMAAVDRIEAAVRAEDLATARGWVDDLETFADGTARPWAVALVAHGRAMTSAGTGAAELFEQALDAHGRSGRAVDRARTRLAYGEWLRRAQHRVDARTHLRQALATFSDLHAGPFERRATEELRASGETARKRDPSTLLTLTPTELTVARLVGSGLTNKEVAAQIWVSPRTVAFHLRNVFAKAGITSRGELARLDLG